MAALVLDPGPIETGWLLYDYTKPKAQRIDPDMRGIYPNPELRAWMMANRELFDEVITEMVGSYQAGKDITETAVQIGMYQHLCLMMSKEFHRVYRDEVKLFLCGRTAGIKDKEVNECLRGYFNAPTLPGNKAGGVLKGFTSHILAALGVAVTWHYHNKGGEAYVTR